MSASFASSRLEKPRGEMEPLFFTGGLGLTPRQPSSGLPLQQARLGWGVLGVQIFFVISGILITGILLYTQAAECPAGRPDVDLG
jgi:hypothetical protein